MDREVKTTLSNMLSHVCCAEDYGYAKRRLMQDLADITGYVTDEEIIDYVREYYESDKNYTEEDVEIVVTRITDWRDTYCKL